MRDIKKLGDEPVYPIEVRRESTGELLHAASGLTKREAFAMAAMQGLCVHHDMLLANHDLVKEFGTSGIDKLQENKAVRLADALIAELNRTS